MRLEIVLPDETVEAWTVHFVGSGPRVVHDVEPDAVVRIGLDDLVRLAAGQADGALLYLAGALSVAGREDLVLGVGSLLRAPGSDRAVIDAGALDPVAVSVAIADTPSEHLDAVMSGGFRELVLTEVFRRLPEFLIAEKAVGVRLAIGFEIAGPVGAAADRYVVRVAGGACEVVAGGHDDAVDATIELEGHEFLRLVLGHLNPVRGVLSGQLRVRGRIVKALGFNAVMRIPGS